MLFFQAPPANVQSAVDRILAAHTKMTSFEARVERPGAPTTLLARSGPAVWLRVPDTTGLFPSTRTLCAKPATGWAYDGLLAEIVRAQVRGTTPSERLASITGAPDDALRLLLEPKTLGIFLRTMSKEKGAKLAGSTLTFPSKEGVMRVTFDPSTRRVTHIYASMGEIRTANGQTRKGFDVRYRYGKFGLTGFAPKTARPVVRPTILSKAGTFESAAARKSLERMIRANARLTRASVTVQTDDATYRVLTTEGRLRQTGPRLDIGYDGKTLVVVDRRARRTYRGTAKRGDVRQIAVALGEPLLPLSAAFLGRSLPFAGVLFPPRRASIGGSLGTTEILKLEARGTRASLFVRPDGLVTSLESEERDQAGRLVARGRQRFTYGTTAGSVVLPAVVGSVLALPKS